MLKEVYVETERRRLVVTESVSNVDVDDRDDGVAGWCLSSPLHMREHKHALRARRPKILHVLLMSMYGSLTPTTRPGE